MTSIHYINLKQIGGEIYCVDSDSENTQKIDHKGQTLNVKIGTGTEFITGMISKEDAEEYKEKTVGDIQKKARELVTTKVKTLKDEYTEKVNKMSQTYEKEKDYLLEVILSCRGSQVTLPSRRARETCQNLGYDVPYQVFVPFFLCVSSLLH